MLATPIPESLTKLLGSGLVLGATLVVGATLVGPTLLSAVAPTQLTAATINSYIVTPPRELPKPGLILSEVPTEDSDLFTQGSCPGGSDGTFFLDAINKHDSPGDKTPSHLVEIQNQIRTKENRVLCLDETVAIHLKNMFDDAAAAGHTLYVTSAYRSPLVQLQLYERAVSTNGWDGSRRVASPFHSEHNFGRAVDLSSETIQTASAAISFDQTPEGQWVLANGYKYGFILSYPRGKEAITGFGYEPWHHAFIGVENAKIVQASGKTFHEIVTDDTTEIRTLAEIDSHRQTTQVQPLATDDIAG